MNISKEIFEEAYKETLENYLFENKNEMTFDEMERIASEFSDAAMKRALMIALEKGANYKNGKKKAYVKSVENMLSQLDKERKFF